IEFMVWRTPDCPVWEDRSLVRIGFCGWLEEELPAIAELPESCSLHSRLPHAKRHAESLEARPRTKGAEGISRAEHAAESILLPNWKPRSKECPARSRRHSSRDECCKKCKRSRVYRSEHLECCQLRKAPSRSACRRTTRTRCERTDHD